MSSLFGGHESASEASTSHAEESQPERSPSPQSAQHPPPVSSTRASDETDALDEDEPESGSEIDGEPTRLGHSMINPRSWRRYTAADRQVAASLEDAESADLAAHLYNTHNLKRRLRRPAKELANVKDWQIKDSWLKKGKELRYEDPSGEIQTELVPPHLWSAWPVPPNQIPAKESTAGTAEDGGDGWYVGNSTFRDTGDVMREEMLAVLLRLAKDKWISRQSDNDTSDDSQGEMQDEPSVRKVDDSGAESGWEGTAVDKNDVRDSSEPQELPLETTFLADDGEARRILEPSVNSLLSRIDNLALAVRRSRLNHFGRRTYDSSDQSGSEFLTDAESSGPRPKISSRPRSRGYASKKTGTSLASKKPPKKTGKKKQHIRIADDSDSASDYAADHESESEEQNSSSDDSQPARSRPTSKNSSQGSNASSTPNKRSIGLMDWSEVLGVAAMTGWNESAIARTAQRCATLFGEGMSFRALDENPATKPVPNPVHYNPSTIPRPEDFSLTDSNFYDSGPDTLSVDNMRIFRAQKRPYFEPGTLRCPHKDCPLSKKDSAIPYRVVEHVQRMHGYDPRTNDSDNEQRTVGGVHIDGFLRPISAKGHMTGRRGRRIIDNDAKPAEPKRKKQKLESEPPSVQTGDETQTQGEQHVSTEEEEDVVQIEDGLQKPPHQQKLPAGKPCSKCKRDKKKCDGHRPCARCKEKGSQDTCRADDLRETVPRYACSDCRRAKVACDGSWPCARCVARGNEDICKGEEVVRTEAMGPEPTGKYGKACEYCRRKKVKCEGGRPCTRCIQLGIRELCQ